MCVCVFVCVSMSMRLCVCVCVCVCVYFHEWKCVVLQRIQFDRREHIIWKTIESTNSLVAFVVDDCENTIVIKTH